MLALEYSLRKEDDHGNSWGHGISFSNIVDGKKQVIIRDAILDVGKNMDELLVKEELKNRVLLSLVKMIIFVEKQ
jgi:hypothetical protein